MVCCTLASLIISVSFFSQYLRLQGRADEFNDIATPVDTVDDSDNLYDKCMSLIVQADEDV